MSFKDHFSGHSKSYSEFRPSYPAALYDYLNAASPATQSAWDCATGSGQAAVGLAEYFDCVYATDASAEQVRHAAQHPKVRYSVGLAEDSGLQAHSVDLVTVGQALHWFRLPEFVTEVRRVARPGGLLSAWTYNLLSITPAIDELLYDLYRNQVYDYWDFDRSTVEQGYANLELPFAELDPPEFAMAEAWSFDQLLGYLHTWSAVKACSRAEGRNPVDAMQPALEATWPDKAQPQTVTWPLSVRVWQLPA